MQRRQLAPQPRVGRGMLRLCPSTSLKPDPGLRISRCRHRRLPGVCTVPLPVERRTLDALSSPRSTVRRSIAHYRSFGYCFVKCDVKDSKITPIRLVSIVLAIKTVVLTLSPFLRQPAVPVELQPQSLASPLSRPFVAQGQVQFAQIQIYPRVTFPRGAN